MTTPDAAAPRPAVASGVGPYYRDGSIRLFCGDCLTLLDHIAATEDVSLLLTDPPYGVAERTDRASKGRGGGGKAWPSRDFPPVSGDDAPFDPTPLLRFRRVVLFGANHYADRLPPSPSWLVWDKLDGLSTTKRAIGFDDNADCELIWTNLGGPARLLPHRWKGLLRASEVDKRRVHPTQKPVALMAQIIDLYTQPGDLVLDPYCGSGPVLAAAKLTGRRAIGVELRAEYCEATVNRLRQGVLPLPLEAAQ